MGSPKPSSLSKNINSPPFCSGTEKSVSIAPEIGATSYTWASSNPSILLVEGNGNYALLDAGYSGTCYFTVTITNNCGTTSQNYIAVVSDCSGGGGEELLVYPNPASTTMTVSVTDSLSSNKSEVLPQSYHLTVFNRFGNSVFSVQSDQCTLQVPVSSLPLGIYCINVFYKDAVLSKQVMISK
ncbi:MAG: T9SS type A sorting domain-containing protein [Bacteroidetes bacterium]|nr:T9SS type A sorting domain-containing protein [Bacteroidota bacterium]